MTHRSSPAPRPNRFLQSTLRWSAVGGLCILSLSPVHAAGVSVDFQEGAPKDRFVITNTSACEIGALSVSIDLSTAPAGLIFHTTADGAGVEVFQPLELDQNDGTLRTTRKVVDGDQVLDLEIAALPAGARVSFTIDLDDTATDSALGQIRVSDAEISGAQVVMRTGDATLRGVFAQSATAVVPLPTCTS